MRQALCLVLIRITFHFRYIRGQKIVDVRALKRLDCPSPLKFLAGCDPLARMQSTPLFSCSSIFGHYNHKDQGINSLNQRIWNWMQAAADSVTFSCIAEGTGARSLSMTHSINDMECKDEGLHGWGLHLRPTRKGSIHRRFRSEPVLDTPTSSCSPSLRRTYPETSYSPFRVWK